MSGVHATALAFAVRESAPADARQLIHVDPAAGSGGRRLLIVVEPREPNPRAFAIAGMALTTLRQAMIEASALPVQGALAYAFTAAHRTVWEENRPMAEGLQGRRCLIGASVAVIEERRLTLAQVPPTQAIILQAGQVYAYPSLASWRSDYQPDQDRAEPAPLGCDDHVSPVMYRTTAASDDIVLLCSSAIAHDLALDGALHDGAVGDLARRWPAGDAATMLRQLEDAVVAHGRETAYAAAINIGPLPAREAHPGDELLSRLGCHLRQMRPVAALAPAHVVAGPVLAMRAGGVHHSRLQYDGVGIPLDRDLDNGLVSILAPEPAPVPEPVPLDDIRLVTMPVRRGQRDRVLVTAEADAEAEIDDLAPPDVDLIEIPHSWPHEPHDLRRLDQMARLVGSENLPVSLTDGLAVSSHMKRAQWIDRAQTACVSLFERLVPQHEPPELPYNGPSHATAAPGAMSIHRYREGHALALPDTWRAALPRGPVIRLPMRMLAIAAVAVLLVVTGGMAYSRYQSRSEQASSRLTATDGYITAAGKAKDGTAADAQLTLAQHELNEAADKGASKSAVAARQQEIDTARDKARGIVRLSNVVRIGGLPPGVAGHSPRLVRSGDNIYVVGGDLYQLDTANHQLVDLLQQGTQVGSSVVGPLQDAAWDADSVTATDGARVYTLGSNGRWTPRALGLFDGKTPWTTAAAGIFQGNVYFLDTGTGQILKFAADGLDKLPEDWASADLRPQLKTARGMVVDGKIYVLLQNGQILSLYRGALQATLKLPVIPAMTQPIALYGAVDTNFLYIADAGSAASPGRIIRVNRDGGQIEQLMLPDSSDANGPAAGALNGVRDLVVDERTGTIYFMTNDAVWQASLPTIKN